MKPQPQHSPEDRLLDFAYGELPPGEARALEAHLEDCPRCSEALRQIRSVRTAMAPLREEAAPEAGLDSLLAYAQQSARRNAEAPPPVRRGWRRLVAPAAGLAAASLFGLVVLRVNEDVDLAQPEPAQVAAKAEPQYAEPLPSAAERYNSAEAPAPASAPAEKDARAGGALAERSATEVRRRKAAEASGQRKVLESKSARMDAEEEVAMAPPPSEPLAEEQASSELARAEGAADSAREEASAPTAANVPMAGAAADAPAGSASRGASAPSAATSAPAAAKPSRKEKGARDPALLTREAEQARASGDRAREALLLREALASGAGEPTALLRRLCEAELSLGRNAAAAEACRAVVARSPGSADARSAQRILEQLGAPSTPAQ